MNNAEAVLRFSRYEEFWHYCFCECRDSRVGCACSCGLRKRLKIPPHGKSYLGKLEGEVRL
ncbi:hypothetical protein MUP77_05270 [Candidatus Bathyarchaeota archaeon]|nr:hypothetical protein [Candidatus Bathyarchaeota archaeon]